MCLKFLVKYSLLLEANYRAIRQVSKIRT